MGSQTGIEWTDHTFNPWWGCSRVSPACDNCYAETVAARWGKDTLWHRKGPRRMMAGAYWRQPIGWNRNAREAGQPARVFCASMADVFEVHPVAEVQAELDAARGRLWELIDATPWLTWQLLTKRVENVMDLVPWSYDWPANVWIGTSVESQRWADARIPTLLDIPARVRFLSCEPMVGMVDLTPYLGRYECPACCRALPWTNGTDDEYWCQICGEESPIGRCTRKSVDWVIAGGESGSRARPMDPEWPRQLRDQCTVAGVPFFFKQWGEWAPFDVADRMHRVGKKLAGRRLDGHTWDECPPLAVPEVAG